MRQPSTETRSEQSITTQSERLRATLEVPTGIFETDLPPRETRRRRLIQAKSPAEPKRGWRMNPRAATVVLLRRPAHRRSRRRARGVAKTHSRGGGNRAKKELSARSRRE